MSRGISPLRSKSRGLPPRCRRDGRPRFHRLGGSLTQAGSRNSTKEHEHCWPDIETTDSGRNGGKDQDRQQIEEGRELDSGPASHRATSRILRTVDHDSLCDPIKGVANASEPGRSVVERGGPEMADHRSEHKQRKVCSHRSCHGRGLPSIIPAMTFSRARRRTRKTSACVVLGWSLKDSIRQ